MESFEIKNNFNFIGFTFLIILWFCTSIIIFLIGKTYGIEKNNKKLHANHCFIGKTWSYCHDGLDESELEHTKIFVDRMIEDNSVITNL